MSLKASKFTLSELADRLISNGILSEQSAQDALKKALENNKFYTTYLVENDLADPRDISIALSQHFSLPLLDLDQLDSEIIPKKVVKKTLIEQHRALPIYQRANHLFVAVSNPINSAIDEFKFQTGLNTFLILVEEDKLRKKIDVFLKEENSNFDHLADESLEFAEISSGEELEEDDEADENKMGLDDAPIVRFINRILLEGIRIKASDIHFEPYEKDYRIRYRVDGILRKSTRSLPVHLGSKVAARMKVMSDLDISERRVPQDGRFKLKLSKNNTINFRVNTCPTIGGEKIVARILDPSNINVTIDKLGYEDFQKAMFLESVHRTQGMVLVTGPTGSGKTVSLYTALQILNTTATNVSTVEDPVEINVSGVNQVNINNKAGLGFSDALRAFLRQDPDVIMVGEIRDLETAEIAIKAAQTGHLVLSTLHTNSTTETLSRLSNMGIPAYNIATSINLIIAQRLARRLCNNCKYKLDLPKKALIEQGFTEEQLLNPIKIYAPSNGECKECTHGYIGRVGIYEVLKMTEATSRCIMSGGNVIEIADQAKKDGLQTLRQSGLKKVLEGITSLDEINRITKE